MDLTRQIISQEDREDLEAQYVGALIGKWMPFQKMDIQCLDPNVIFTPVLKELYTVILDITEKGKEPLLISVASAAKSKNPKTTWTLNEIFKLCMCVTRLQEGEYWEYDDHFFFLPDEDIIRGNVNTIQMAYQEFLIGSSVQDIIEIQQSAIGYPVDRVAAMMETLEQSIKNSGRSAVSLSNAIEKYGNQTIIYRQQSAVTGSTYPFWWGNIVNPTRNARFGSRPLFCQPGHLNLLMAQYKAGKSTCAEMLCEWNAQKGQRWVYVHAENTLSDIIDDMIKRYAGADYTKLLAGQEQEKFDYVKELTSQWPGDIHYIHASGRDIESVIDEIKEIRPDGCAVDYMQILEVSDKVRRLPDYEVYAYKMRKFKQLAEWSRNPMLVMALSQTNEKGEAFGAKALLMQAQIVWQWYREPLEEPTQENVKSKQDLMGRRYRPEGTMMINIANNFEPAEERMNFFGARKFMSSAIAADPKWWANIYEMYGDWILTALGVDSKEDIPNSQLLQIQKKKVMGQIGESRSDLFKLPN